MSSLALTQRRGTPPVTSVLGTSLAGEKRTAVGATAVGTRAVYGGHHTGHFSSHFYNFFHAWTFQRPGAEGREAGWEGAGAG